MARKTRKQLGLPPLPRGRPRRDALPPIQRRLGERDPAVTEVQRIQAIRHEAGRGLPEELIAAGLEGVEAADLLPGGKYHRECLKGKREAALTMADKVYEKCMQGRPADALEWLQHNAEWRKPARDVVRKSSGDEPDKFEIEFIDAEPPKRGRGKDKT